MAGLPASTVGFDFDHRSPAEGIYTMKIGLFSDIHSNLSAMEAVLAFYAENPCDEYYCLGDVVGYGPQPDECCSIVRDFAKLTIMGNHDAAEIGRASCRERV